MGKRKTRMKKSNYTFNFCYSCESEHEKIYTANILFGSYSYLSSELSTSSFGERTKNFGFLQDKRFLYLLVEKGTLKGSSVFAL